MLRGHSDAWLRAHGKTPYVVPLSAENTAMIYEWFTLVDEDGSGQLNALELAKALKVLLRAYVPQHAACMWLHAFVACMHEAAHMHAHKSLTAHGHAPPRAPPSEFWVCFFQVGLAPIMPPIPNLERIGCWVLGSGLWICVCGSLTAE